LSLRTLLIRHPLLLLARLVGLQLLLLALLVGLLLSLLVSLLLLLLPLLISPLLLLLALLHCLLLLELALLCRVHGATLRSCAARLLRATGTLSGAARLPGRPIRLSAKTARSLTGARLSI